MTGVTRGAAAELIVAADLMRKGHAVYRALSPNAPFDLVSFLEGDMTRIEVRSAHERKDRSLSCLVTQHDDCDLYALVCGDRIEYMLPTQVIENKSRTRLVDKICIICKHKFSGTPTKLTCSDACHAERVRCYNRDYARNVRRAG